MARREIISVQKWRNIGEELKEVQWRLRWLEEVFLPVLPMNLKALEKIRKAEEGLTKARQYLEREMRYQHPNQWESLFFPDIPLGVVKPFSDLSLEAWCEVGYWLKRMEEVRIRIVCHYGLTKACVQRFQGCFREPLTLLRSHLDDRLCKEIASEEKTYGIFYGGLERWDDNTKSALVV